jgi:hypothetical protein
LTVADAIADIAGASGGEASKPGPRHVDVHLSNSIAKLFRCTAAKRHRQIIDEPP